MIVTKTYRTLFSAAILVAALTLSSCSNRHSSVAEFRSVGENGWPYGKELQFAPQGLDSIMERSLMLTVCHSNYYPYRNLWVEVKSRTLDRVRIDTLNIELADVYGRWHGTGFGPSYQMEVAVGTPMPIGDTTRISVRHIMRVDTLNGVEQIGVTVIPAMK